ncbi:SigE family RNA polymerase sigma factor [Pseudonocardiaceae bacterium YIM PH 21723]|nr:SigE family RNA polymerase sigma factor [Pseudonocardiaceae bacterium YIM PH 21723]
MRAADREQYTAYVTGALPRLHRIAYLLCGDAHRADDVVQTAITRLFTSWSRARSARNLDAYVRAIVVRSFLNERRMRWSSVQLLDEDPQVAAAPGPDIETREQVRSALVRVPPRQRAVLVLRFLEDLPICEVARLMRCSEGTVKSQTSLGLATLRKVLEAGERHDQARA